MDPRNAVSATPSPEAIEFVRFCYRRRRVGWPELYDEMCAVAGRGLFRGYDADDLAGIGIGFSLFDMPALSVLAGRIVAEEHGPPPTGRRDHHRRRPGPPTGGHQPRPDARGDSPSDADHAADR